LAPSGRTPSATYVARYNAEWLVEKNGYRSPDAARAAWNEEILRAA
jgi:hypothetical protein